MVKVSIVGFGRAGQYHLKSLRTLPFVEIVSVFDPEPIADEHAVPQAARFEEVLQEDIDAVIIASPTEKHFEHVRRSLQAGKHVFAEKPLGRSADEIRGCFSMAEEFDRHLFIGFQRRYDGNFKELKQQMPQLRPRVIKSCSRDNPSPSLEFLRRSANIFHDMLIHDFDMLINLNGPEPPNTIYTLAHAHDPDTAELADYDTTMVTLKYPSGLMCCIDTSRCAVYGYDQRIEVFGAEGMAIAENQRIHTLQVSTERGTLHAPLDYSFPERYEESYRKEMLHFIEGLHSGSRYNVTLRECLLSHLMVKAAHQSVLQNRPIDFVGEYGAHLSG